MIIGWAKSIGLKEDEEIMVKKKKEEKKCIEDGPGVGFPIPPLPQIKYKKTDQQPFFL